MKDLHRPVRFRKDHSELNEKSLHPNYLGIKRFLKPDANTYRKNLLTVKPTETPVWIESVVHGGAHDYTITRNNKPEQITKVGIA